jgi:hypothetical protein
LHQQGLGLGNSPPAVFVPGPDVEP